MTAAKCSQVFRNGEPCRAWAAQDGLCNSHHWQRQFGHAGESLLNPEAEQRQRERVRARQHLTDSGKWPEFDRE